MEDQFRLHPLQEAQDNCIFKKKNPKKPPFGVLCGMIATTYLAKPALYTLLVLKGPQSTMPCERQTHVNENTGGMWPV